MSMMVLRLVRILSIFKQKIAGLVKKEAVPLSVYRLITVGYGTCKFLPMKNLVRQLARFFLCLKRLYKKKTERKITKEGDIAKLNRKMRLLERLECKRAYFYAE